MFSLLGSAATEQNLITPASKMTEQNLITPASKMMKTKKVAKVGFEPGFRCEWSQHLALKSGCYCNGNVRNLAKYTAIAGVT